MKHKWPANKSSGGSMKNKQHPANKASFTPLGEALNSKSAQNLSNGAAQQINPWHIGGGIVALALGGWEWIKRYWNNKDKKDVYAHQLEMAKLERQNNQPPQPPQPQPFPTPEDDA